MRRMLLSLFLSLIMITTAESYIIVNSQSWRDCYILTLYSKFSGEDFNYVTSLGDLDLMLRTLDRTKSYTIFESMDKPVIEDLKSSMMNYGFSMIHYVRFKDYKDLQYSLYEMISPRVEGFIVVRKDFAYDAISVFPYAVRKKYWVLFYDEDDEKALIEFLNKNKDKPVIFYGDFLTQPWKKIKNRYEVLNKGIYENNKEIVKRAYRKGDWIILVSGEYITKGMFEAGVPILLLSDDLRGIAEFLTDLGVRVVEVIGPENVDRGRRIREMSGNTIGVVARIGRMVTGDPYLRGKLLTLPSRPTDYMIHDLRVKKILFGNNTVLLILENKGNVEENFRIFGVRVVGDKELTFTDPETHKILPGEVFSIPFYANFSWINYTEVWVYYGYDTLDRQIRNEEGLFTFYPEKASLTFSKSVELEGLYYDKDKELLWIKVYNPNEYVWLKPELYGITIAGKSYTLTKKPTRLKKGENIITFKIYLDEEDFRRNSNIKIRLYYGPEEEILTKYSEKIFKGIEVKRIEGIDIRTVAIVVILLVVLFVVIRFLRLGSE